MNAKEAKKLRHTFRKMSKEYLEKKLGDAVVQASKWKKRMFIFICITAVSLVGNVLLVVLL